MSEHKTMTVRLPAAQAEALALVASVDNMPVSEVVRAAIAVHIAQRQNDSAFRRGLEDQIERAQQLLVGAEGRP